MKTFKYLLAAAALGLTVTSCYELDLDPKGMIGETVLLKSDNGIKKYFAVVYQDLPVEDFNYKQNGDEKGYASVNQSGWHKGNKWQAQKGSPAAASGEATGRDGSYGDGWGYWPYDRIRDINNFIANFPDYRENYKEVEYNEHLAEAHFLRAFYYFGIVKRYGGVPIVTEVMDPKAPVETLQLPRSTEYDCWMLIHDDLDFAMKNGATTVTPGRGNRYAAAALMSRAMLYAGSIAKYGNTVGTTGPAVTAGLMGIPASHAQEFFQYAYDACKLIEAAGFKLHTGADKEKAYVEVFLNDLSSSRSEDIFVKQYGSKADTPWNANLFHCWDTMVLPRGEKLANDVGAALHPLWELVGLYEMPAITDADGKPVRFNKASDIWSTGQMEARCKANFYFPGMTESVSGVTMDIQAGVYTSFPGVAADATTESDKSQNDYTAQYRKRASDPGKTETINGQAIQVNGKHGYAEGTGDEGYSTTGVLIRKYVNANADPASRVLFGSQQSWKVFRYGEVLCNWAEAAYELGLLTGNESLKKEAFDHVNALRDRAGAKAHAMVANPEDIGLELYGFSVDENLQYIRDERARELCLENHRLYDIRRWRVAHIMHQNYWPHVMYPYYVMDEGKYIFLNEVEAFGRKTTFEKRWYYEQMPGGEISKNPNIIRNDGY